MKSFFIYAISISYFIIIGITIYQARIRAKVEQDNQYLYRKKTAAEALLWVDSVSHKLQGRVMYNDSVGGFYINEHVVDSIRNEIEKK